jgi:hypothetical protein
MQSGIQLVVSGACVNGMLSAACCERYVVSGAAVVSTAAGMGRRLGLCIQWLWTLCTWRRLYNFTCDNAQGYADSLVTVQCTGVANGIGVWSSVAAAGQCAFGEWC